MVTYGQPRRLNAVTITMILLALAAGYWMWRFFPAYFDGWTVDHILMEAASSTYRINRYQEPGRTKALTDLVEETRKKIQQQANITDPDLDVSVDIPENGEDCAMTATYSVVVTHPFGHYTTTLHMKRTAHADIKRVKW
jgi:hypothetical protein